MSDQVPPCRRRGDGRDGTARHLPGQRQPVRDCLFAFLPIGADKDHVHFLVQSVPTYSPTQVARLVKSLTARAVFRRLPQVKRSLWGGAFWTSGFFIRTVGRHGNEAVIRRYVQEQGRGPEYQMLPVQQLGLFDRQDVQGRTRRNRGR